MGRTMNGQRSSWMTDEHVALRDAVRLVYEKEFVPHEARWAAAQKVDRETWHMAGRMGLLCASIPEAYGGGGGDFGHEVVIAGEQARALVSAFGNAVHSGIVSHYIYAYGNEAQRRRWLPRMATGELVGALAMSEPGAGSDLQKIRTHARREGGEYVVNGAKTFITNGFHANLICLAVKTDTSLGAKGVSLIVVETDGLAGFRRGRLLEKMGQKGQDTAELFFDDVRVPADNLLGEREGLGFSQLMQQLPRERLVIASNAVATMERAIEETLAYVRERKVFGGPLGNMQNTRFKLAECRTRAAIARCFVDDCIGALLRGTLPAATAAMAKLWCTEQNCAVIDECLQLHGGYGYMTEYPISRMYANARVGRIYGGSNEVMKEVIARTLL